LADEIKLFSINRKSGENFPRLSVALLCLPLIYHCMHSFVNYSGIFLALRESWEHDLTPLLWVAGFHLQP